MANISLNCLIIPVGNFNDVQSRLELEDVPLSLYQIHPGSVQEKKMDSANLISKYYKEQPASSPTSPASITEEISTKTMSDVVKDFDTKKLIEYLKKKNLKLKEPPFKILRKEKIAGLDFLKLTEEKLECYGIKGGPATRLVNFIEGLSQKLQNYSSLKTLDDLKEMLHRNKVNGKDITNIKQFTPAILHTSIAIAKKLTFQDIFIVLQKDISSEDVTGRVDYTIKSLEEFLCITEGKSCNIKIGYA
ncbi:hypothetical protein C1645_830686 [Glomus cerebriforme]|uniref:SAM domain-containing protein n=1 Tax=Glomus cerebriforme TaxID=658196 RepID=A0A397SNK8_9GLOM|nr:hypothetical protein C1645_830686 [Glomus cerebriforme]